MSAWEYKVVPAPTKGVKARGIKGPEGRFAYALEILMNDMAAEGWEFQRAETLPSLERSGLTGTTTEWRNMMVFRRTCVDATDEFEHELLPAPEPLADADPDPTEAAATLQRRDEHPVPTVFADEADDPDALEHVETGVTPKASEQSEDETKKSS